MTVATSPPKRPEVDVAQALFEEARRRRRRRWLVGSVVLVVFGGISVGVVAGWGGARPTPGSGPPPRSTPSLSSPGGATPGATDFVGWLREDCGWVTRARGPIASWPGLRGPPRRAWSKRAWSTSAVACISERGQRAARRGLPRRPQRAEWPCPVLGAGVNLAVTSDGRDLLVALTPPISSSSPRQAPDGPGFGRSPPATPSIPTLPSVP